MLKYVLELLDNNGTGVYSLPRVLYHFLKPKTGTVKRLGGPRTFKTYHFTRHIHTKAV